MMQAMQACFVLHTRDYRDSSLLVDLFTCDQGIMRVIANGAKRPRSPMRGVLQPFLPLLAHWSGKGELQTLRGAEIHGTPYYLQGATLLSCFYLNELLVRLLHHYDPHPGLFRAYHQTLAFLQNKQHSAADKEGRLRLFEKVLLQEIGYALQLDQEAHSGSAILADCNYRFSPEIGLVLQAQRPSQDLARWVFSGKSLLALHQSELDDADCLRDAKRLMRLALAPLLGDKPMRSRELFVVG